MKASSADNCNGVSPLRVLLALVIAGLLPLFAFAAAPAWWAQRGVTVANASADDYAPANQGQLKNIAKAAVAEMDAKLSGGAGQQLHNLVDGWSNPTAQTNDFAPLNLGQLKNVAKLFYDRLIAAGLASAYPWASSVAPADNFAAANIGQVKNLFRFEIAAANTLDDPLGDRLAASQRAGNLALEAQALWFWGNGFGGNGIVQSPYPQRLSGLPALRSVSMGDDHLVVLATDGAVWSWGKNNLGQLGDGTNVDRVVPAAVPNLTNVQSVKAGGAHTLALQQDGTVLAWGDNYYGQLGNGDNVASAAPVQVLGLSDVRKIAAGPGRSVALKNDGTVWTWGYDHYAWQSGQDISSNTPAQVPDLTDVVDIAVGYEHVVVVKADGTVWAWGSNYSNQVGNGNPWWIFQQVPVQVPNLANVVKVASSFDHSLALLNDGTVWAWGYNGFGQLGDGTSQARQAPVQVSGLTDVIAIATNYSSSLAMKADGTVWAWGDGASGTPPGANLHLPQPVTLGLLDANANGMDDRWEIARFGNLDQTAAGDFDGDGLSNLQEFLRGSDPTDYFNGLTPMVEIVSGDNQIGDPETLLAGPLVVRVSDAAGAALVNAPVGFTVSQSWGRLALSNNGDLVDYHIQARTDSAGEARVYYALPAAADDISLITATAGPPSNSASVVFTATTTTPPPPSTPEALTVVHQADGTDSLSWSAATGNQRVFIVEARQPDGSWRVVATIDASITNFVVAANSTASSYRISASNNIQSVASAESNPPAVRYVVLDLGTDQEPNRVANNGTVLLGNRYRWHENQLETLQGLATNVTDLYAADMNNDGVVVGQTTKIVEERTTPLSDPSQGPVRSVNRVVAAKWPVGQTVPVLLPAAEANYALTPPSGDPYPTQRGIITDSRAETIDDDGTIFGEAMPPGGYQETTPKFLENGGKANHWGFFIAGYNWGAGTQLGNLALLLQGDYYTLTGENRVTRKARNGIQVGNRAWGYTPYTGWAIFLYMNANPQFSVSTVNGDDVDFFPLNQNNNGLVLASDAQGWFLYDARAHTRTHVGISNAQYIRAFNNRQLSKVDSNGTPVVTTSPQLIGGYNGNACVWEQAAPEGKYLGTTLNQLIPADSGWQIDTADDINDSGVIACVGRYRASPTAPAQRRACLLLPVQLQDASTGEIIRDTARIKGHASASDDAPEMPKLEATIIGAPTNWQVEWRLENRYSRRSGKDDFDLPKAEDPAIVKPGGQPWKIWETINSSSGPKFFGGDVKVKYVIRQTGGGIIGGGELTFKIRGENPADDRCKAHIIENQGAVWYAWAVAKHESRDSSGIYNQFANGRADGTAGAHGARGEPFYSPVEGNGWGLFQRDESSGHPVTTEETWSWDGNMKGFLHDEYPEHLRIANTYVDGVKRNNPDTFEEPQFTIEGINISGRDMLGLTSYNGLQLPPGQGLSARLTFHPGNPAGQRWTKSLPNAPGDENVPYVNLILRAYNE